MQYIFTTNLISILLEVFWDTPDTRIETVQCLSEVSRREERGKGGLRLLH